MEKVFSKFDLDIWMKPIWGSEIIYNEPVCLIDKTDKARLLFDFDEIIDIRSHSLEKKHELNKDLTLDDKNYFHLTDKTKINYLGFDKFYSGDAVKTKIDGKLVDLYYTEEFFDYQFAVTYKRAKKGKMFKPTCHKEQFTRLIKKLEKGEDVTLFFFGDSITNGCNATLGFNKPPFTPTWAVMFAQSLAKKYSYTIKYIDTKLEGARKPFTKQDIFGKKGTITFINPSVGGWHIYHAIDNFDRYVKQFIEKYGCDLFVFAFGGNDGINTPKFEAERTQKVISKVLRLVPDTDLILVSTFIPNPDIINIDYEWNLNQPYFEKSLIKLAKKYNKSGKSCAVAPMTSVTKSLLKKKRYVDITGNNINHPNDFVIRLYAQTLYQTVIGF